MQPGPDPDQEGHESDGPLCILEGALLWDKGDDDEQELLRPTACGRDAVKHAQEHFQQFQGEMHEHAGGPSRPDPAQCGRESCRWP